MAERLTGELVELIAERFRVLGEVGRLCLRGALRAGERSVGELMEATGLGQANLSRHLQQLHALHFVTRRKEGLFVFYRLAGDDVFRLCDLMCGRLEREAAERARLLERSG
jgi:DNA-binding transcriptional ArsR family regulator